MTGVRHISLINLRGTNRKNKKKKNEPNYEFLNLKLLER
ncbi:hypothetical protein LINPERPRIM_LOCUS23072, partial [Linum perenne]